MKFAWLSITCLVSSAAFAVEPIEVFCTHLQCKSLGISDNTIGAKVYVIDKHRQTEKLINETVLAGVKSMEEAERRMKNSPQLRLLEKDLKQAGDGLQKILQDYALKKLPAFVCHRRYVSGGYEDSAVIYGGTFTNATAMCSQWARGQR